MCAEEEVTFVPRSLRLLVFILDPGSRCACCPAEGANFGIFLWDTICSENIFLPRSPPGGRKSRQTVLSSTSPRTTHAKVHGLSFSSDSVLAYPPSAAANVIERVSTPPEVEVVTLFNELRDRLLRYLLVVGLSAHDGEEIIQESFLLLFQHLKQGKSRQNLRGWVFRVARNLALKQRSSNQLRLHRVVELDEAMQARQVDRSRNPEEQLQDRVDRKSTR